MATCASPYIPIVDTSARGTNIVWPTVLNPAHNSGICSMPDAVSSPGDAGSDLGPYTLLRELGRGGQGTVWLARDRRFGRQLALKILTGLGTGSVDAVARFRREAAIASRLDDPGICTVFDAGVHERVPWIAMRYIDGESLADKIARCQEAGESSIGPVGECLRLFEQLARSLQVAHDAGVIHRDIKSDNIMLTPQGLGVIMDFGLAHSEQGEFETLTRTGDIFGTPAYMSPEQLSPERGAVDHRTDIWSLGVTLYECLTLRRPFEGPTRDALYQSILGREPSNAATKNPAISTDLKVLLLTVLEKDVHRRYRSAEALAQDLVAIREGRPISVRPISWIGRTRRWVRRAPARAALVAFLMLTILASAGLGGYLIATLPEMRNARAMQESEDIERLIDSGLMSLFLGDRRSASRQFEHVLSRSPRHPDAIGGLVASHLRLLNPERSTNSLRAATEAEAAFQRYSPDADKEPELAWIYAYLLRERGQEDEASILEQRTAARLPKTSMRHLLDGIRPYFLGWYGDQAAGERALHCLQAAIARSPRPRLVHYWILGEVANYAAQPSLSRVVADAIRIQWPDSAEAQLAAGLMLLDRSSVDEAIHCLEEAVRRDPKLGFAWSILAERKADRGDLTTKACEEALPDARRAIEVQPELAYAHHRLGILLRLADRLDEALIHARTAINLDPEEAMQHLHLGHVLERLANRDHSDLGPALRAFERAVELGLERHGVHLHIACTLAKLGHFDQAEAHIHFCLKKEAGRVGIRVHTQLAEIFARAGRTTRAREFLKQLISDNPKSAKARNLAAWTLVGPGWKQSEADALQGLEWAKEASALSSEDAVDVLTTLGVAWYRCGEHENAVEALRRADQMRQKNGERRTPTHHAFLALALSALGRDAEAMAALDLARTLPCFLGDFDDERRSLREAESKLAGLNAHR